MSTDANKTIVERFFDGVLTRNDQTVATQLVDPACVFHHPMLPNGSGNALDVANLMAMFRSAFPDLSYQIEDLIAEHDKVAARWTARGTHLGDFSGVKATGRAVRVAGTDIFLIAGGRIVETWVSSDSLGLMRQIGAVG